MKNLSEYVQSADWKTEKHVPVIECDERVAADQVFEVKVGLGKEVAHPNTTEHHIRWIRLYFHPEEEKYPFEIGNYEFNAHGESTSGLDQGTVYAHHQVTAQMKTAKPGTLHAMAFCNIHGLWENSKELKIK